MTELNIKFDKRYELIFGLQFTVGKKNHYDFPWIKKQATDYEEEFYAMAQKYISKEFESYILKGGLGYYEGCCKLASAITDTYEIQSTQEMGKLGVNVEKLSNWLKDFVEKSNYESFFQEHQEYYKKVKQDLE